MDVGCGTGYFSRRLTAYDYHVTALDLAPGMLAQARRLDSAQHYLLADMEHLPLADECVDLCFCNLAIQWCASLPRALGELMRVTRPGGGCCLPPWPPVRYRSWIAPGGRWMVGNTSTAFCAMSRSRRPARPIATA